MQAVEISIYALGLLIALALLFDFLNGFHDAANSVATVVSTGALTPQAAVALAALFNFVAIFVVGLGVASTLGRGTIAPGVVDQYVIFGALVGAIAWGFLTWRYGLPSSSSHGLIGGLIGAAVAKSGGAALVAGGILKMALFILAAPLLGFVLGSLLMLLVSWSHLHATPRLADRAFRRLQILSVAGVSLGHGGNDAQKTIGIIWMLLIAAGEVGAAEPAPPLWVIVCCYLAISLGTLLGGWRIVKTMGLQITRLRPVGGFCAESAGALTLLMSSYLGVPVSTTHTMVGAIAGAGAAHKTSSVRWGVAGNIVWAWVVTMPAAALVAALAWWLGQHLI